MSTRISPTIEITTSLNPKISVHIWRRTQDLRCYWNSSREQLSFRIVSTSIINSFIYFPIASEWRYSCDLLWHTSPGLSRINRVLIPISCNFFSGSRSPKNSEVKRAWPGAIWGWVTGKSFPGAHEWGQSVQKRHVLIGEDSLCPKKLPDVRGPVLGGGGTL